MNTLPHECFHFPLPRYDFGENLPHEIPFTVYGNKQVQEVYMIPYTLKFSRCIDFRVLRELVRICEYMVWACRIGEN